jgi:ADP-sugar diphosphatase
MNKENLKDAHKFKLWKKHLEKSGLTIHGVEEKFTRHRYNGEILFSTLMLDATTPEGDKVPPICFLKGEVVCIGMVLIDEESNEKYLLLVKQRRIAEGDFTYEHPAGMVDNTKTPLEIAVQEIKEETGVEILADQLINLSPNARLFPSTGTSDEAMYFFACEIKMPLSQIKSLDNNQMGTTYEFERITTLVRPFAEGHIMINNTNGLLLNYLYLSHVGDWELLKKLKLS